MHNGYYSVKEISILTGKTIDAVRQWCNSGKLEHIRPGGGRDIYVHKTALAEFWPLVDWMSEPSVPEGKNN